MTYLTQTIGLLRSSLTSNTKKDYSKQFDYIFHIDDLWLINYILTQIIFRVF